MGFWPTLRFCPTASCCIPLPECRWALLTAARWSELRYLGCYGSAKTRCLPLLPGTIVDITVRVAGKALMSYCVAELLKAGLVRVCLQLPGAECLTMPIDAGASRNK